MTVIVGLLGPAESGKSTSAQYLVDRYGARRYALATPLKEIARRAFDLSVAQVYGTQADKDAIDPRYNVSARWLLKRLGTEGIRAVLGADFWWKYALDTIARDRPEFAVIDDVRFINEAEGIGRAGGFVWRLDPVPGRPQKPADHQSELEWMLAKHDARIAPRSPGLEHLYREIDAAMAFSDFKFPKLREFP